MYRRRIEKVITKVLLFILHQHLHKKTETASDFILRTWKICQHSAVTNSCIFWWFCIYSLCLAERWSQWNSSPLNLCIDNSLTFAQLSVSLWIASASSLFSCLWLRSLLKALAHLLLCTWRRWTPTPARHHGSWLLAGSESTTRRPLSLNIKVLHLWACRHDSRPGSARLPAGWLWGQPPRCGGNYWRTVRSECSEQNLTVFTTIPSCHWF